MNYDMNMIKYRKSGFFRIAAAILMICFTLFGKRKILLRYP